MLCVPCDARVTLARRRGEASKPGARLPSLGVPGRVLFELSGVPEDVARESMRLAGHKLPIKTRFVMREAE